MPFRWVPCPNILPALEHLFEWFKGTLMNGIEILL